MVPFWSVKIIVLGGGTALYKSKPHKSFLLVVNPWPARTLISVSLVFDNNVSDGDNVVTEQFAESSIRVYPQHFPAPFEARSTFSFCSFASSAGWNRSSWKITFWVSISKHLSLRGYYILEGTWFYSPTNRAWDKALSTGFILGSWF